MAITARRTYETKGPTIRIPGLPKASTTFYPGQLLVWDTGVLAPPTDAAAKIPAGVYPGTQVDAAAGERSYTSAASGNPEIDVERGLIWVPFSGAAQTDVGAKFYLADNGDVTKTAGNKTIYVLAVAFKTGHVLLDFNHPLGFDA
jgi:hypothetical protein